jgi:hypothetical protein
MPSQGYPGLPVTVSGKVSSQQDLPLSGRSVKILFDSALAAETQTDADGSFKTTITISAQAKLGQHKVTVAVDPKGLYMGTSQQLTLNVAKMTSKVEVHVPSFVLLPAQIHVEGKVSSASNTLANAQINLKIASVSVATQTLADGSFNATVDIPLSSVFVGYQDLNITVTPAEPWHAAVQAKTSIFVISSANVGFASVAFISISAVAYFRFASGKPKKQKTDTKPVSPVSQPPLAESIVPQTAPLPSKPQFRFDGAKGKVVEAYARAVNAVERAVECTLEPDMTLREFLQQTKPKISNAVQPFAELTELTEKTIYSPFMPEAQHIAKAQELAETVGRLLKQ